MNHSFSIIINTLNRADNLQIALTSLQQLRHKNYEVIVVNGPSTDNTNSVISQFAHEVKIGHCEEANLSKSRNIGIAMARGDIIAFIDDDAIPEPDWLDELERGYVDDSVAAVGGFIRDHTGVSFQAKVTVCDRYGDAETYENEQTANITHKKGADRYYSLTGTNSSIRRGALLEIGGFDEEYAYFLDETDVMVRLIDAGYKVKYIGNAEIHHKYAESHLRTAEKIPKSIYLPVRSKAYFCLRNAQGHYPLNHILNRLHHYSTDLKRDKQWLLDHDKITQRHFDKLIHDIDQGIKDGIYDSLVTQNRRLLNKNLIDLYLNETFLPFKPLRSSANRLRICFLSQEYPPDKCGGIGIWTHTLATALAADGHEVTVVARGEEHATVDYVDRVWVHRIIPHYQPGRDSPKIPDLPQIVKDYSYTAYDEVIRVKLRRSIDIISAPIWDLEGIACVAAGLNVTVSLHSTYKMVLPSKDEWLSNAEYKELHVDKMINGERWILDKSPHILANSKAIIDDIEREYDLSLANERISILYHGLKDLQPIYNPTNQTKASIQLLFVGRLEKRKGIDILLAALPAVLNKFSELEVVLVGEDVNESGISYKNIFLEKHKKDSILERVHFKGFVPTEQLPQYYCDCDIFVAPSRYESFGLVFLEAMMFGKVCIGTKVGGITEILEHEYNGMLIPSNDIKALEHTIEKLLSNKEIRDTLGKNARENYERKFTSEKMRDGAAKFYSKCEKSELNPADISLYTEHQSHCAEPYVMKKSKSLPKIQIINGHWKNAVQSENKAALVSYVKDDKMVVNVVNPKGELVFNKHSWSGVVEVVLNGRKKYYDLYSEHNSSLTLPYQITNNNEIVIRNTGEKNKKSKFSEIWFLGITHDNRIWLPELGKIINNRCKIIDGDWGNFLVLRNDIGVAKGLEVEGVWAGHDVNLFKKILSPGMTVVDVGANFGHHSVVFSKIVGAKGRVLAIEPQRVMYNLLNGNIVINGLNNVETFRCALGESHGFTYLWPISYDNTENFGALGVYTGDANSKQANEGEKIEVRTLNELINNSIENNGSIDFIKIDVQTFELYVLKGALDTLDKYRPMIFLEVSPLWMEKTGYDYREIYYILKNAGYNIFHPTERQLDKSEIMHWDGRSDIEWDILAVPKECLGFSLPDVR